MSETSPREVDSPRRLASPPAADGSLSAGAPRVTPGTAAGAPNLAATPATNAGPVLPSGNANHGAGEFTASDVLLPLTVEQAALANGVAGFGLYTHGDATRFLQAAVRGALGLPLDPLATVAEIDWSGHRTWRARPGRRHHRA